MDPTYYEENMKKMTRGELKNIAVSYGIFNGYHDRNISRMRKTDFIDYILESLTTPTSTPSQRSEFVPMAPIPPPIPPRARAPEIRNSQATPRTPRSSLDNLIIHFVSPLTSSPRSSRLPTGTVPLGEGRRVGSTASQERITARRLDFDLVDLVGPLDLLDIVMMSSIMSAEETRNFIGEIPTEEEEAEQAHESVRCTVCLHNKVCVLLQKCKHVVTCGPCSKKIVKCPICKNPFEESDRIRVFLP